MVAAAKLTLRHTPVTELDLLPLVFPDLVSGLGAFPLPQSLGLDLQGVDVGRQGEFMSLFADLVPSP